VIIPNEHLETPNYEITRLRDYQVPGTEKQASYAMAVKPEVDMLPTATQAHAILEEPALKPISQTAATPPPKKSRKPGLLARLWAKLFGGGAEKPRHRQRQRPSGRGYGRKGGRGGGGGGGGGNRPRSRGGRGGGSSRYGGGKDDRGGRNQPHKSHQHSDKRNDSHESRRAHDSHDSSNEHAERYQPHDNHYNDDVSHPHNVPEKERETVV